MHSPLEIMTILNKKFELQVCYVHPFNTEKSVRMQFIISYLLH